MKVIVPGHLIPTSIEKNANDLPLIWQGASAVVLEMADAELLVLEKLHRCISYLDQYVVVCPVQALDKHRSFWDDIVTYIAPDYYRLVKREVNLECLRQMFNLAEIGGISIDDATLVDFGCGHGVIQSALVGHRPELVIGIEKNSVQRVQAEGVGLHVVSSGAEIDRTVDLIVASFSLHMGCSRDILDIARLWLKPGGMLLANCYKGVGIEHVDTSGYLDSLSVSLIPVFAVGRGPLLVARRYD